MGRMHRIVAIVLRCVDGRDKQHVYVGVAAASAAEAAAGAQHFTHMHVFGCMRVCLHLVVHILNEPLIGVMLVSARVRVCLRARVCMCMCRQLSTASTISSQLRYPNGPLTSRFHTYLPTYLSAYTRMHADLAVPS